MSKKHLFVDLPVKSKSIQNSTLIESGQIEVSEELKKKDPQEVKDFLKRRDLEVINGLNKNGPLKQLGIDDVNTRSIIILGVEPTSKMSIHPEGTLHGKTVNVLSQVAKAYPGVPMMVGHVLEQAPWGRTFRASVLGGMKGYAGPVVKNDYWFLNDDEGNGIARKIDGGIWAEGSIQYYFKEAKCSICHKALAMSYWFGKQTRCKHKIGEKDPNTGDICYWYPNGIDRVIETSYVYAGAYPKTKSMTHCEKDVLSERYSQEKIESGIELEKQLTDCGLNLESEENDEQGNSSNGDTEGREHIDIPSSKEENSGNSDNQEGAENSDSEGSADQGSGCEGDSGSNGGDEGDGSSEGSNSERSGTGDDSGDNSESENGESESSGSSEGEENSNGEIGGDSGGESEPENGESNGGSSDNSEDNGSSNSTESAENSESTNSDKIGSDGNSNEEGKAIHTTQDTENTDNSESVHGGEGEEDSGSESQENSGNGTSEGNNVDSESQNSDGNDTSVSDSLEKYQVIIDEIISDDLLRDEKEDAIRDELLDCSPEVIDAAILLIDKKPEPKHYSCLSCYNDYSDLETELNDNDEKVCKNCGGSIGEIVDYSIELSSFIGPIHPKKCGLVNNEFYDKDVSKDFDDGQYYVEPNYHGVYVELHKSDGVVKLLSGVDLTEKFPGILAEAELMSSDNFVVTGQLTKWRGRKRLNREDVQKYIDQEKPESGYDDHSFKLKLYDKLIDSGTDISGNLLSDRKKKLSESISYGKHIQVSSFKVVDHKKGENDIVLAIDDRKTREGTLISNSDSIYSKSETSKYWEWKQEFKVDCEVKLIHERENGTVYTCEIGYGKHSIEIGDTFPTKLSANVGDVISVLIDHVGYDDETKKYNWFAPKVVCVKNSDSKIDPVSTIQKVHESKSSLNIDQNFASLSEVIPLLKKMKLSNDIYLTGNIVENGVSTDDIEIVSKVELSDTEKESIIVGLGDRLGRMTKITHNSEGPEGMNLKIEFSEPESEFEFKDKFVVQCHGTGNNEHFDIRLGHSDKDMVMGFSVLESISKEVGGNKSRCFIKNDHETLWMKFDTDVILPKGLGSLSKTDKSWMLKDDEGNYDLINKTESFVEVVFHGEKYSGRYVFKKLPIKSTDTSLKNDEISYSDSNIWIMWKPKNQESNSPVKKLAYKFVRGCLTYWESDEFDTE